jgi:hypothetical protein
LFAARSAVRLLNVDESFRFRGDGAGGEAKGVGGGGKK